jgi:hypothetical protein
MIAAAHREASNGNADESDDVMVVGRKLRESKTISEEMSKLAMEEARLELCQSIPRKQNLFHFRTMARVRLLCYISNAIY